MNRLILLTIIVLSLFDSFVKGQNSLQNTGNPIIPGYYADPSIVTFNGKFYIFATIDPWGDRQISCWESDDFENWDWVQLNWPTREQCNSQRSTGSMVWAPSVMKGNDGKFHMFVSSGSEVYSGIADQPAGPWKNILGEKEVFVKTQVDSNIHTIDAEPFLDEDGKAYLYWGSGWDWKNGHCMFAPISRDWKSFSGSIKDITPAHYFEAPYMLKHNGKYYLMYSEGKCVDTTYKVQYSVADKPEGPYILGKTSPILSSNPDSGVIGPGHHTILQYNNKLYILYHRISLVHTNSLLRQVCVDEFSFDNEGNIKKVVPSNSGVKTFLDGKKKRVNLAMGKAATASSLATEKYNAQLAFDGSYATLWMAPDSVREASLVVDLGNVQTIHSCNIEFEFAVKNYKYRIEFSTDGKAWKLYDDKSQNTQNGSPMKSEKQVVARFLRVTCFRPTPQDPQPAIWEVKVY